MALTPNVFSSFTNHQNQKQEFGQVYDAETNSYINIDTRERCQNQMTEELYNERFGWTMWTPQGDGGTCFKFWRPDSGSFLDKQGYTGGCPGTYSPSERRVDDWENNMGNLEPHTNGYVFEFMPNHKPYEELYCWKNNDTIEERSVYT